MRRTPLILLLVALALAMSAVPAAARTRVAVGLGDQHASMFEHPAFHALKVRKVRYFVRWDAMRVPSALQAADQYVQSARAAGIRVFLHVSTNDLRHKRAKLPTRKAYRRYVGRLVRHFKALGVRDFGVWNEANHKSQPTWRNPARAAQYFVEMRRACGSGCSIVALDVLDQAGVERYIDRFYNALSGTWRARARLVGIHNYSDTNRFRSRGTAAIIRAVKHRNRRADFWLTETGGVVAFGRSFKCSEKRAARAISYMFSLARKFRRDVKRLYAYNWSGSNCKGFDAGLTRRNGKVRPGYRTFKSRARSFTR
ncbi:MAG TPA: hypothetical protein VLB47_04880 [Solirubrobacteraceae bacterium]|nr:hypothetical protein [Solirubrobacteraceae bacterium]